jgi:hypothetical protein
MPRSFENIPKRLERGLLMYAMLLRRVESQDSIAQRFWRHFAVFSRFGVSSVDFEFGDPVAFVIGVKEVMCRWIVVIVTRAGRLTARR